jgi:hypothetical protein
MGPVSYSLLVVASKLRLLEPSFNLGIVHTRYTVESLEPLIQTNRVMMLLKEVEE